MSVKFDKQIEEVNTFIDKKFIKRFVRVRDFDDFKKSMNS